MCSTTGWLSTEKTDYLFTLGLRQFKVASSERNRAEIKSGSYMYISYKKSFFSHWKMFLAEPSYNYQYYGTVETTVSGMMCYHIKCTLYIIKITVFSDKRGDLLDTIL